MIRTSFSGIKAETRSWWSSTSINHYLYTTGKKIQLPRTAQRSFLNFHAALFCQGKKFRDIPSDVKLQLLFHLGKHHKAALQTKVCKDSFTQYEHYYSWKVPKCHVNQYYSIHSLTVHSADRILLLPQAKPYKNNCLQRGVHMGNIWRLRFLKINHKT